MRFEIPGDLTKEIGEVTKGHYRAKLNRLAASGFVTRSDLLDRQVDVCAKIWELSGEDTGAGRQSRRLYLSAIFWILHERPLDEKRLYYDEFQKAKDNYKAPVAEVSEWRDISGCSPYQAHPSGQIRRVWKHKTHVMNGHTCPLGYMRVSLSVEGKRVTYGLARLIAQTFVPNPENKPEVDHINNDPGDDRAENLRWVDRSEQLKNRRGWSKSRIRHIDKLGNKWRVIIRRENKTVFQKLYDTQDEAIKARDDYLTRPA